MKTFFLPCGREYMDIAINLLTEMIPCFVRYVCVNEELFVEIQVRIEDAPFARKMLSIEEE